MGTLKPLVDSYYKQSTGKAKKAIDANAIVDATIYLKTETSIDAILADVLKTGVYLTRDELAAKYAASPENIQKVIDYAASHGLSVGHNSIDRRSVSVRGTAANIQNAFGVQLSTFKSKGVTYRVREGYISVDESIHPLVEGVFGLDNRVKAKTHFQILGGDHSGGMHERGATPAASASFYPTDLAKLYNYPTKATGAGQCIGIIELGGGHVVADLNTYFSALKIPTPNVIAVGVDGATNAPVGNANSADGEVMLDIEVAGAIAPNAKIAVYYAPNTDKGFLDAITQAVNDKVNAPSVISISWGNPEINWTAQSMTAFDNAFKAAAAVGVTVTAASGDQGSSDGTTDGKVHVDFPSSSPYVLACGGTKIALSTTGAIAQESVWNAGSTSSGGGGVSDFFALPSYQANAKVPVSLNKKFKGRGVPDVAADADPASGYKIRVDGGNYVFGGTSAVAPLMAGLIALINQLRGKNVGFMHPTIYANTAGCRDITVGNNITTKTKKGFTARAGWDACTGWGVVDGAKLATVFGAKP